MSASIESVDAESLRNDIMKLVRKTVDETLNALVDENAPDLVEAGRLGAGALKAPAFYALWNGHDYATLPHVRFVVGKQRISTIWFRYAAKGL